MSERRDVTVQAPTAVMKIEAPARADGYRPIAEALWRFARIVGGPGENEARYVLAAARRLDAAHEMIERVRERLSRLPDDPESIEGRRQLFATVGDAEVAIIALHRAVEMAAACESRLATSRPFPGFVASKRGDLRELRVGYEHIEERAFGLIGKVPDEKALKVFEFGSLFTNEQLQFDTWSLGLNDEATRLMIETRDYLVQVWTELVGRNLPCGGGVGEAKNAAIAALSA